MHNRRPTILQALFVETGTYDDMTSRPYQSNHDVRSHYQFQEATQGGTVFTPEGISSIVGNFLRPKAQHQGVVQIENGWDTPRLRFSMHVEIPSNFAPLYLIVTGYTDYVGINRHTNTVDPAMMLHINNVVTLRTVEDLSPMGAGRQRHQVQSAAHVLGADYNPSINHMEHPVAMRPYEVFSKMSSMEYGTDILDTRQSFASGTKLSQRKNGSAPHYVSSILKQYNHVMDDEHDDVDFTGKMSRAGQMSDDGMVTNNDFFFLLNHNTRFEIGNQFTYGEFSSLFPEINHEQVSKAILSSPGQNMEYARGRHEHWNGTTAEVQVASILSHSIPSLMMDLMMTKLVFKATNRTTNGQMLITPITAHGFANIDLSPYMNQFINRANIEVFRGLTHDGQIDFDLEMMVDILGDTTITISMHGQPPYTFTLPSFCDALYTPVMSTNDATLTELARNMHSLADGLRAEHHGSHHSGFSPHGPGGSPAPMDSTPFDFGGFNGSNSAI